MHFMLMRCLHERRGKGSGSRKGGTAQLWLPTLQGLLLAAAEAYCALRGMQSVPDAESCLASTVGTTWRGSLGPRGPRPGQAGQAGEKWVTHPAARPLFGVVAARGPARARSRAAAPALLLAPPGPDPHRHSHEKQGAAYLLR